jgi:hypothetical protein
MQYQLVFASGQEQEERVRGEQAGHVHQPVHHLPTGQRPGGPPGPLGPQAQLFRELQKVGQIFILVFFLCILPDLHYSEIRLRVRSN